MAAYLGKENTMRVLANQNRNYQHRQTWSQMFSNIDIASQQAESAVKYNFAQDVSDAYDTAMSQKSSIYGGNYRTGLEQELLNDINSSLEEAYSKSMSDYQSNLNNVYNAKSKSEQAILSELDRQAQYVIDYEQAHIDYVKDIWNKISSGEYTEDVYDSQGRLVSKGNIPSQLFKEEKWSRFVKRGDPIYNSETDSYIFTNEEGDTKDVSAEEMTPEYIKELEEEGYTQSYNESTLLSDEEIRNMMYDEQGNLTAQGTDIYDLIENDLSTRGYTSFQDYLESQDKINKTDLASWAASNNQYNVLSNQEQFKQMVGLDTSDSEYRYTEYLRRLPENKKSELLKELNVENPSVDNINKVYEIAKKSGLDISKLPDAETLYNNINERKELVKEENKLTRDNTTLNTELEILRKDYYEKNDIYEEMLKGGLSDTKEFKSVASKRNDAYSAYNNKQLEIDELSLTHADVMDKIRKLNSDNAKYEQLVKMLSNSMHSK